MALGDCTLLERQGTVAILTINRPKVLNALDVSTLEELAEQVSLCRSEATRCVVVTGAGDRAFVAGADIAAMAAMSPLAARAFSRLGQTVVQGLESLSCPVIAAVNGFALGGGMELALACDFIFAADSAKFGQPEINLGIIPGFGGTQRLARRIGLPRAREVIYSGETIDAAEAWRLGIVNRVFPRADLLAETTRTANELASKPPIALQQAKISMNAGYEMALAEGCRLEAEAFAVTFSSEDSREGMNAFLQKRKASFEGR